MPATRSASTPTSGSSAQPGPHRRRRDRENPRLRSLVHADDSGIDDTVFDQQHVVLLRLAAEMPHVDRIFVNKFIKQRLCQTVGGDRSWLNKLVAWAGHDEHFHVRLHCPPGNPQCQPQAGYHEDDGCGAALDIWFTHRSGHRCRRPAAREPSPTGRSCPPPASGAERALR